MPQETYDHTFKVNLEDLPAFYGRQSNIRRLTETLSLRKRFGLAGAQRRSPLLLEGAYHRFIEDARIMARLLPFISGRKTVPA